MCHFQKKRVSRSPAMVTNYYTFQKNVCQNGKVLCVWSSKKSCKQISISKSIDKILNSDLSSELSDLKMAANTHCSRVLSDLKFWPSEALPPLRYPISPILFPISNRVVISHLEVLVNFLRVDFGDRC